MAGLQWRGGVIFRMKKKKKMAVVQLGDGRRNIFRAICRLRPFYAGALENLLEGAAAVSTMRAQYASADCSFGTGFAPAFTIGKRH